MLRFVRLFVVAVLSVLLFAGCDESVTGTSETTQSQPVSGLEKKGGLSNNSLPNIVEIASGNSDFSLLVAAVVRANLVDALSGNRQLTVFAPPNTAFNAIGIYNPEDFNSIPVNALQSILLYHVVPGNRMSNSVVTANKLNTLLGESIYVDTSNGVMVGNSQEGFANVVAVDIQASNGIIHVIDGVLFPPQN
jgi:uncharacterized surface protein with fasciclin (FAS1) repeats